jgi:hypothetical protein
MKNHTTLLIAANMLLTNSCAWLDASEHVKILDDYEVGWNDTESNRAITKPIAGCDGCHQILISNYVYAVGHNRNYIIAKQSANDTQTNYYIIDIVANKKNSQSGILGPLTENDFSMNKKKLNIESIEFDMNYTNLLSTK